MRRFHFIPEKGTQVRELVTGFKEQLKAGAEISARSQLG
jgi:hypothetical protein